jgi:hypothetical protein
MKGRQFAWPFFVLCLVDQYGQYMILKSIFWGHGEAPPGYPLQVLARSSLWAFRYYPLPKGAILQRGVHPINMSIDNTKIFFDILTIIQINLTPIIVIDFKR